MILQINIPEIGPIIPATVIGLIGVLFFYLYSSYKNKKDNELKVIQSIQSDEKKAEVIERQLNEFGTRIDTQNLTTEQKEQLLLKLIRAKTQRYLIVAITSIILAIIIAFVLKDPAPKPSMQLTVYVHGEKDSLDIIKELDGKGKLIVDFGNDRRNPQIGENGRTNMGEIPIDFQGKQIPINIQSEDYEASEPSKLYVMYGTPIYFKVKSKIELRTIEGNVRDNKTLELLSDVLVISNGVSTNTDSLGHFKLIMPKNQSRFEITAKLNKYKNETAFYVPKSSILEVRLIKVSGNK
jgi:hypothetical protein